MFGLQIVVMPTIRILFWTAKTVWIVASLPHVTTVMVCWIVRIATDLSTHIIAETVRMFHTAKIAWDAKTVFCVLFKYFSEAAAEMTCAENPPVVSDRRKGSGK